MALLHRDRPDTTTADTVAGPTWPVTIDQTRDAPAERVVRRNSFGQTLRTILATILLVGVVAVAAANTDQVGVDLLFESYDVSLSALVGCAAGAGFLIGVLLAWRSRRVHSI
jgi:uncharacterized integral membrane protein